MKQKNKNRILYRYYTIVVVLVLVSVALVGKLFFTTVVDANAWNARARAEMSKVDTIAPERGNILASNGSILACNVNVYDIKLDIRHAKITNKKPIPWARVDSFADMLDKNFPRVENLHVHPDTFAKYSWHTRLKQELEKPDSARSRALRIVKRGTMSDFDSIRRYPWIKDMNGSGRAIPLYVEEKKVRLNPFGKMARRSIGRVNERENGAIHGYSGLECDLDSLLYGKPGLAKKVTLTSGISNWVSKSPVRGYDILTTIDIDIQDTLEEELLKVCMESNAVWGTAIIMEVATGEIKGISNLELLDNGEYGEAINRAVMGFEPGSVMKPISLMIAFEDGLVKSVNDAVDCSPFQRTKDPHAPGVKTMKQVIEMSSNTGIARVIFRGYSSDPAKFHDRLASIGFFEPMHTGIAGERTPVVRRLVGTDRNGNNITMTARHLDLARQAYGYNTEIPPLYTLSIYNAIANKGRYVRPHLVKALIDEDGRDSVLPVSYIRDRICSEETADKVKQCIREVVWGSHGTARLVQDDRVCVVGKTGTAYPVEGGTYNTARRRYAFCGFFPYDNPRYSCIALVLAGGGNSANRTSAQVVKNVALKLFARGKLNNKSTYTAQRTSSQPVITLPADGNIDRLKKDVGITHNKVVKTPVNGTAKGIVPNVVGMDVASAVKTLETTGLNVKLVGTGRVVGQNLKSGTRASKGSTITLTLKI